MIKTLTAAYASNDAARNALDELISDGIDREKMYLDTTRAELKVMIPATIEREITEILARHDPRSLH